MKTRAVGWHDSRVTPPPAPSDLPCPYTFHECADCAAKPGSPDLCAACLHNRRLVDRLRESLRAALQALDRARSATFDSHDELIVDAWRKEFGL